MKKPKAEVEAVVKPADAVEGATGVPVQGVPAVAEAPAEHKMLNPENFAMLWQRYGKIAKDLLGSLGNSVRLEQEGAPVALAREADGTLAWGEVAKLGDHWEQANGGEGAAAYLFTAEGRAHYQDEESGRSDQIKPGDIIRLVGRAWGITPQDIDAALEQKRAEDAEYQQKLDRRNDGPEVPCTRTGCGRMFQPVDQNIVLRDGGVLVDKKSGRSIRTGNYLEYKQSGDAKPKAYPFCPSCRSFLQRQAMEKGLKLYFSPREDIEQRLRRDGFDETLFAQAKPARDKRRGGRDPWLPQGQSRGRDQQQSGRDQRRSGQRTYTGRGQGDDGE